MASEGVCDPSRRVHRYPSFLRVEVFLEKVKVSRKTSARPVAHRDLSSEDGK